MNKNIYDFEKKLDQIQLYGLHDIKSGSALHYKLKADDDLYKMPLSLTRSFLRVLRASVSLAISEHKNENAKVIMLFSNSYRGRDDYMKWFEAIAEKISDIQIFCPAKRTIYLKNLMYLSYYAIWIFQTRKASDIKRKLIYLSILYEGFIDYQYIIHRLSNAGKILAVVSDTHLIDSMVVQHSKDFMDTATFQHGMYLDNSDSYVYSKSKYFLTQGEFSKQQAIKSGLEPSKLIVLGMPSMVNKVSHTELYVKKCNEIAIFLTGDFFSQDDINMLKIILKWNYSYGYKLKVKPHPNYGLEKYDFDKWNEFIIMSEKETAVSIAENSMISVTNGSTLFAEFSSLLLPVIDYRGTSKIYSNIKELGFTNIQEFDNLVHMFLNTPSSFEEKEKEIKELFCINDVTKNYFTFFNSYC